MTGNEMTEMERKLWEKVFRINASVKNCIENLRSLQEEIEREVNIMNAPSKESVLRAVNTEQSLREMMMSLMLCQERLKRLNPNFMYN
jgi:hypothetical protein